MFCPTPPSERAEPAGGGGHRGPEPAGRARAAKGRHQRAANARAAAVRQSACLPCCLAVWDIPLGRCLHAAAPTQELAHTASVVLHSPGPAGPAGHGKAFARAGRRGGWRTWCAACLRRATRRARSPRPCGAPFGCGSRALVCGVRGQGRAKIHGEGFFRSCGTNRNHKQYKTASAVQDLPGRGRDR